MKILQIIFTLMILTIVSANKTAKAQQEKQPLVHEYIQLAIWLLFGMLIGIFFEAKITFKQIVKPIAEKGVTGLIVAASIYGLFMFGSIASRYL